MAIKNPIILKQRLFRLAIARQIATAIYGKKIYASTWSQWVNWANIVLSAIGHEPIAPRRKLDGIQLQAIAAIALLRRGRSRCELSAGEIKTAMLEVEDRLKSLIKELDGGWVTGEDAIEVIERYLGDRPSRRTLYRRGIKQNEMYQIKYVLKVA